MNLQNTCIQITLTSSKSILNIQKIIFSSCNFCGNRNGLFRIISHHNFLIYWTNVVTSPIVSKIQYKRSTSFQIVNTSRIMKPVYFVLFLVLCALIDNALSLSCIANFCEREEMIAKCKLAPKRCPKGYALRRAGLCSCCNVCKKILCTY